MRQAGRYLPEYRELRRKVDFVTLCKTPDLAAEATLQPINRFGLDAAILFSDILVPAESMGFKIDFVPGPVIDRPVATADDVARVRVGDADEIAPYVYEAVRILRRELEGKAPLIGFAAAPFTLAAYLVEGKGSRSFDRIKRMMFHAPETTHTLLDKIATVTERYLGAQIGAGAQAIQLFDSWAGLLSRADYREFALPYARRVLETVDGTATPRIYFALNNAHFLEEIRECGAEVVGMDWRLGLDEASSRLDDRFVLQGNLDPCVLLAGTDVVRHKAADVLAAGAAAPGHVFNLGHGILPHTPVESVETLVETVRDGGGAS
jgi:uroporphyrinogen decarboxylase